MYRPRPLTDKLTCDICSKPAKWYDRVFASTYVLGEALCDECNGKFMNFFKPCPPDSHLEDDVESRLSHES